MTAQSARRLDVIDPHLYRKLANLPENLTGEIIDGELVVSPRPQGNHAQASSALGGRLDPFALRKGDPRGPGGWWILDEPELHLAPQVVVPDLAGWRRERVPLRPLAHACTDVPDWVCEVVSPRSRRRDRMQKARIYLETGTEWLWLVEPGARTIECLHAHDGKWLVEGVWGGDEPARIPPFDELPLDLDRLWDDGRDPGAEDSGSDEE